MTTPYGTASVLTYGADPTGVGDSTPAFNAAIAACTGSLSPVTYTRTAVAQLYVPAGTYKITSDLVIQSVSGFSFLGASPAATTIIASGTGFSEAVLLIDGSADGVFGGFAIQGDGTEMAGAGVLPDGIRLDWTTAAARSTTANKFSAIRVRSLKAIALFSLEGTGSRQLDGTVLEDVVVTGGQTAGSWSSSGPWQAGFALGDGVYGNNYDHVATGCGAAACYYGWKVSASSVDLDGSQPAANYCDFYIESNGQTSIKNIQSQNSGQFVFAPSQYSPSPVTIEDVTFTTLNPNSGYPVMSLYGGPWKISNVCVSVYASSVYQTGVFSLIGQSSTRPCIAAFDNIVNYGTKLASFSMGSNVSATVRNFSNYNPSTGLYAAQVAGDMLSVWSSVTGNWVILDHSAADWFNVKDFGAKGDGATNDTAAIQAAVTAAGVNGGIVYFPASTGDYVQASAVSYSGSESLFFQGDGAQASRIRGTNTSSGITYYSITLTNPQETSPTGPSGINGQFGWRDLSFVNAASAPSNLLSGNTQIFLSLTNVDYGYMERFAVYYNQGSVNPILQAIQLNACTNVRMQNAMIFALVNCVQLNGSHPAIGGLTMTDCILKGSLDHSGNTTDACLDFTGDCETIHLRGVTTTGSQRGILARKLGGYSPQIIVIDDFEPNSHTVASCDFQGGQGQIYIHDSFFSPTVTDGTTPACHIQFGSFAIASIKITGTSFFTAAGHTISFPAGCNVNGVLIEGCTFGGAGTYKYAANSYDEINIAGTVAGLTIANCHFNTEGGTLLGSNVVRSALYVTSGATASDIRVNNCLGAGSDNYGTAGIIDALGVVQQEGNTGLGFPDSQTGLGGTVTAASATALGPSFNIPAYDPRVGNVYHYHAWGHGVEASGTAVNLNIYLYGAGSSLIASSVSTNPGAGSAFTWEFDAYLHFTVAGVGTSGAASAAWRFTWGNTTTLHESSSVSLNTQNDLALVLYAAWASTAGSPSITSDGAFLCKILNYPAS